MLAELASASFMLSCFNYIWRIWRHNIFWQYWPFDEPEVVDEVLL